jgi:hypothetical protein
MLGDGVAGGLGLPGLSQVEDECPQGPVYIMPLSGSMGPAREAAPCPQ